MNLWGCCRQELHCTASEAAAATADAAIQLKVRALYLAAAAAAALFTDVFRITDRICCLISPRPPTNCAPLILRIRHYDDDDGKS